MKPLLATLCVFFCMLGYASETKTYHVRLIDKTTGEPITQKPKRVGIRPFSHNQVVDYDIKENGFVEFQTDQSLNRAFFDVEGYQSYSEEWLLNLKDGSAFDIELEPSATIVITVLDKHGEVYQGPVKARLRHRENGRSTSGRADENYISGRPIHLRAEGICILDIEFDGQKVGRFHLDLEDSNRHKTLEVQLDVANSVGQESHPKEQASTTEFQFLGRANQPMSGKTLRLIGFDEEVVGEMVLGPTAKITLERILIEPRLVKAEGYHREDALLWTDPQTGEKSELFYRAEFENPEKYLPHSFSLLRKAHAKSVVVPVHPYETIDVQVEDVFGEPVPQFEVTAYLMNERVKGTLVNKNTVRLPLMRNEPYSIEAPGYRRENRSGRDLERTVGTVQMVPLVDLDVALLNADFGQGQIVAGELEMSGKKPYFSNAYKLFTDKARCVVPNAPLGFDCKITLKEGLNIYRSGFKLGKDDPAQVALDLGKQFLQKQTGTLLNAQGQPASGIKVLIGYNNEVDEERFDPARKSLDLSEKEFIFDHLIEVETDQLGKFQFSKIKKHSHVAIRVYEPKQKAYFLGWQHVDGPEPFSIKLQQLAEVQLNFEPKQIGGSVTYSFSHLEAPLEFRFSKDASSRPDLDSILLPPGPYQVHAFTSLLFRGGLGTDVEFLNCKITTKLDSPVQLFQAGDQSETLTAKMIKNQQAWTNQLFKVSEPQKQFHYFAVSNAQGLITFEAVPKAGYAIEPLYFANDERPHYRQLQSQIRSLDFSGSQKTPQVMFPETAHLKIRIERDPTTKNAQGYAIQLFEYTLGIQSVPYWNSSSAHHEYYDLPKGEYTIFEDLYASSDQEATRVGKRNIATLAFDPANKTSHEAVITVGRPQDLCQLEVSGLLGAKAKTLLIMKLNHEKVWELYSHASLRDLKHVSLSLHPGTYRAYMNNRDGADLIEDFTLAAGERHQWIPIFESGKLPLHNIRVAEDSMILALKHLDSGETFIPPDTFKNHPMKGSRGWFPTYLDSEAPHHLLSDLIPDGAYEMRVRNGQGHLETHAVFLSDAQPNVDLR